MAQEGGFLDIGKNYQERYGFSDSEAKYVFKSKRGLDAEIVSQISEMKKEPKWMKEMRLQALEVFLKKPMPTWGDTELLNSIQFGDIFYYLMPTEKTEKNWEDVPETIKNTFEKLGIPEAERKFLAGVTSQYDSQAVYHKVRADLEKLGVIFLDMDAGLREHEDIVREYFASVIPMTDNKFAALNTAVWSGGSFIYIPKGVKVELPLQAYFRINAKNAGQFERTLIIADEGSSVHYIEGCLPEGELVSLGDTFAPIEEVKPGMKALNSLGELALVSATRRRPYKGKLYKIVPVSVGNSFELTPEHPVWAIRREGVSAHRKNRSKSQWEVFPEKLLQAEPEWVPAGELKAGDILCFPIASKTKNHPEISDALLKFLGYYLAEGSAFFNGKTGVPVVNLSFNIKEREKIEEAKKLIFKLTGKKAGEFKAPEKHESRVYVYSHELLALSWKYCGRHAAFKKLHQDIMELPPKRQKLLLETYLKGDGSRHTRSNGHVLVRASTISQALVFQIQEILARLGIYAGMQVRKAYAETMSSGREIKHKESYSLHFEEGLKIHQVWKDKKRNCFWVPVRKIETRDYDGFVYNLEMEKAPNAYLAKGFAVHNCTAPTYATDALHSAVVELIAKPGAHIRYTTIQNWSNNVFNLVTKRAIAQKDSIVEWLDGNLGCVRQGELVYSEQGPQAIEKIEPGTKVWGFDQTSREWILRPVLAVKESGLQRVYEVVFSNGRTVHLTDNHPLLSVHYNGSRPSKLGRYSLGWTPVKDLSKGSFVVFPTSLPLEGAAHRFAQPAVRDTFTGRNQYGASYAVATHSRHAVRLPAEANEDVCWMLGLWLAEGDYTIADGVNGDPRFGRVGWSVPKKDRAHKRLVRLLNNWLPHHPPERRKDGVYFRTNSLEFALWLKANGFSSGAREKRVPGWVFSLPRPLQLSFLAGYLDGDGCAHASDIVVKSANPALLSDVQMLAALCGIHAGKVHAEKVTLNINGTGRPKTYIVHRLALSRVGALRPFLSPGFKSRLREAKLEHWSQRPMGMRATRLLSEGMGIARIVAIRPSIVAPTYDLEVAGTSSFVVNGILVHNSKLTMKFPAVYLAGEGARGEIISCAFAGKGQHQDAGAKLIFAAPHTSGTILSKSVSKNGGRASYRGLVKAYPQANGSKVNVRCDALLMDADSRSDTYPTMEIDGERIRVEHEATVSKIGEEQLFYLMSRGLKESDAVSLVVNGFFEAFTKELPLEYAVELNRLIQLEMEGAVG